jgi:hypothetical protein
MLQSQKSRLKLETGHLLKAPKVTVFGKLPSIFCIAILSDSFEDVFSQASPIQLLLVSD